MKINDVVFQDYQGIRRYGVVREKYFIDDWAHVEVDWVNDQQYDRAMNTLAELRNVDCRKHVYRIDEVRRVNAEKEISTLNSCLRLTKF